MDLDDRGQRPRFLIHDRDTKFTPRLRRHSSRAKSIKIIRTPVRAPNANAHVERWVGSVRRECLDRLLIFGRRQLEHVLRVYVRHYNQQRPHRALDLRPPTRQRRHRPAPTRRLARLHVQRRDLLGGLIHEYELAPPHEIEFLHPTGMTSGFFVGPVDPQERNSRAASRCRSRCGSARCLPLARGHRRGWRPRRAARRSPRRSRARRRKRRDRTRTTSMGCRRARNGQLADVLFVCDWVSHLLLPIHLGVRGRCVLLGGFAGDEAADCAPVAEVAGE